MRTRTTTFFIALLCCLPLWAADTLFVHQPTIPILLERQDNVLFYLRVDARQSKVMNDVMISFDQSTDMSRIASIKLYYGGTEGETEIKRKSFKPVDYYIERNEPGKTLSANLSYSILHNTVNNPTHNVILHSGRPLFPGINYFWISIKMKPHTSLFNKVTAQFTGATIDGKSALCNVDPTHAVTHRMGIGLRHAGDNGVNVYRIPGLATSNKGTLLAIYDVRYNNGNDLQEHIDIGLSRSTDGGNTWDKMRLPISLGEAGGLPKAQNGTGDPAILVDTQTGTIWIVAAWLHGIGHSKAWFNSGPGMDKNETAQLIMVKSNDDGLTWSSPINVTQQVKQPSWRFLLQGPGRGITMKNGTLVFPIQYIDSVHIPHSGIMYSQDHGKHWNLHTGARTRTTEAQVAEISPGELMLNMRDDRGGSRAVSTTTDMGRTWKEHSSSRSALQESICQASLIHVDAKDNMMNKDLLLFSNPNVTKSRNHITIKASLDSGKTWPIEKQLLIDDGEGWGYSCLTMIDRETVGILYEGSAAQMTFQAIKLKDILH